MNHINKFVVSGNLTKDPEIKTTKNGKNICVFSIANNTGFGDFKNTNFYTCEAYGKNAETIKSYFQKGSGILIDGEHSINQYEKDGQKKKFEKVKVNQFFFINMKGEAKSKAEPKKEEFPEFDGVDDFESKHVPF